MKTTVNSLLEVPEPLRGEYEERDGAFHLKLDGETRDAAEHRAKLAEFRDNNRQLKAELDALRTKMDTFRDVNPEEYRALKEKLTALEQKGVKGADDVQEAIQKHLAQYNETQVKPLKIQLEQEKAARAEAQEKLNQAKLREVIGGAVTKAGARPDALNFLLADAEGAFQVKDGEVTAKPDKYSQARPAEPLSVDEWIALTMKKYAFAFEITRGGSATTSNTGVTRSGKVVVDPTPQQLGELARAEQDPFRAGVRIVHSS